MVSVNSLIIYLIISAVIHGIKKAVVCTLYLILNTDKCFLFFVRYYEEFLSSCICLAVCFLVVLTTTFAPVVWGMKAYIGCGNLPYQLAGLFDE